MDTADRLAYYKRLQADNIALTAAQNSDMLLIIKERGAASVGATPAGGSKHQEGKNKY